MQNPLVEIQVYIISQTRIDHIDWYQPFSMRAFALLYDNVCDDIVYRVQYNRLCVPAQFVLTINLSIDRNVHFELLVVYMDGI